MSRVQWSYRQAAFCLIGSTLATLLLSTGAYGLWKKSRRARLADSRYRIAAIVQTGPEKEALKTSYLAEILDLSADHPASLYAFDVKVGKKRLEECPLIASAEIRRIDPGTLYVDYTVRKPVARLGDYENTALDKAGYLFPLSPFFAPKNLPEIYLGLPPFNADKDAQGRSGGCWRTPLENKHLQLAFEILRFLEGAPWQGGMLVKRVDVSNAFAPSYGQREIVLITQDEVLSEEGKTVCVFPKIVRLPSKDYAQQLSNFLSLRRSMLEDYKLQMAKTRFSQPTVEFAPRIVDLRLSKLAFIQNDS